MSELDEAFFGFIGAVKGCLDVLEKAGKKIYDMSGNEVKKNNGRKLVHENKKCGRQDNKCSKGNKQKCGKVAGKSKKIK